LRNSSIGAVVMMTGPSGEISPARREDEPILLQRLGERLLAAMLDERQAARKVSSASRLVS
jgi:hypothetical protein